MVSLASHRSFFHLACCGCGPLGCLCDKHAGRTYTSCVSFRSVAPTTEISAVCPHGIIISHPWLFLTVVEATTQVCHRTLRICKCFGALTAMFVSADCVDTMRISISAPITKPSPVFRRVTRYPAFVCRLGLSSIGFVRPIEGFERHFNCWFE